MNVEPNLLRCTKLGSTSDTDAASNFVPNLSA